MIRFFVLFFFSFYSVSVYPSQDGGDGTPKPYITGNLIGGLGNHFFIAATTYSLAWDNNAEAYFPALFYGSNHSRDYFEHFFFRCKTAYKTPRHEWKEGRAYGYYPISFKSGMSISGYFQNEKYFAHHRDRLLELFAPHPDDLRYVEKEYDWIINHPQTVSVHLRYYYGELPKDDRYIQYDRKYFEKAMALFPETSLFVVTSDNIAFARKNIPTEGRSVVFIENEPYYVDFILQSRCKHNIISNSTFSWWSAWLNQNQDKIVVRPKKWLRRFPDIGGPEEWIKVDALGMRNRL